MILRIVINFIAIIIYLFVSVFGMPQIVGSFQHIRDRGIIMTLLTTIIWMGILGGLAYLGMYKLNLSWFCVALPYVIALIMTLKVGRIDE